MAVEIKHLREAAGVSRRAFSEYFNIPYRTVQDWELGARVPPEYVIDLIQYKLHTEGLIKPSAPDNVEGEQ